MQSSSQDPMNPNRQSSSYSQSGQPSDPLSDFPSSTGQGYQPSPYPRTDPQFAPPPPQSSSQRGYPPGEEAYYNQRPQDGRPITGYQAGSQGKLDVPPVTPKQRNVWRVISLILFILVLILATTTTLLLTHPFSPASQPVGQATPAQATGQPGVQKAPTSVATQAAQATQATSTTSTSNNYVAAQPGPGCDTGEGMWTPQGFSNIACGTQLTNAAAGTPGYLYFQLPHNEAFSGNNEISIAGGSLINGNFGGYDCLGLAEQDANTGLLVEYCGNGSWSINSISSAGAVIKTLSQGLTSERQSEQLSLTLNGTALSFSVDAEKHTANIPLLQPVKAAIMASQSTTPSHVIAVPVQNFSYTTLSN